MIANENYLDESQDTEFKRNQRNLQKTQGNSSTLNRKNKQKRMNKVMHKKTQIHAGRNDKDNPILEKRI